MNFTDFIENDITVHTDTHAYRGVLVDVRTSERRGNKSCFLVFEKGVDKFYISAEKIVAVTVHGREFGTE
jgi:hypothetical protein